MTKESDETNDLEILTNNEEKELRLERSCLKEKEHFVQDRQLKEVRRNKGYLEIPGLWDA